MARLLLSLTFACAFFSFNTSSVPFEGVITYKTTVKSPYVDKVGPEYLCDNYGTKEKFYMNETGYVRQLFCRSKKVQTRWFTVSENLVQYVPTGSDTSWCYYANSTEWTAKIKKSNTKYTICGYNCTKFMVSLEPKIDSSIYYSMRYNYYVANDLPIFDNMFDRFKDGGYDEIMRDIPGVILKMEYYGPFVNTFKTATKVKRKKVDLEKFKPQRDFIKEWI